MRRIAFGVATALVVALWPLLLGADGVPRDGTCILTSDPHYDAFENDDRNARNRETVLHMNEIATVAWPAASRVDRFPPVMRTAVEPTS